MGVTTFTIETWFRRDGAGVATATSGGSGGVTAIPLVTKGRSEDDGSNTDMNYFLGIRSSDNVLAADFEDNATGANHAVTGIDADHERRLAPRGRDLQRQHLAPLPGRRPRRDARHRRLHAAIGQHPARRPRDIDRFDRR